VTTSDQGSNQQDAARQERIRQAGEDQALLAAHVAGDPDAFAELFRRHRDRLWAVAIRTLGDREEAADALQDAMISAFRNAASFRAEAAVTTWMHRIVVNACLDRIRRRAARPTVPIGDTEYASARDEHSSAEIRLDVQAALAAIPESQRAAIVLVDMQDVPVAEAAVILGVAEGTIKSRCSRGRVALAHLLRQQAEAAIAGNRRRRPRVAPAEAAPVEDAAGPATRGGAGS
jgi:RNA polymerase sigma-70 factor (ECF subfamily)